MTTRATVLVVDDDSGVRRALAMRLGAVGFEVHTAASGSEALAAIRTKHLDAALIDVRIPDADGFAVCEHIRKSESCKDIPVVMLTGCDDGVVRNFLGTLSSTVGATHYVTKPCDGQVVAERLWNMVQPRPATPAGG
jgi:CheY-like chemotaxis protein